jgi:hypothetical protein
METYAARYNDYVGERCLALIWLRLVHFGQDQTMPTQWNPQSSGDFTIVPEGNFFATECHRALCSGEVWQSKQVLLP